jgi:hypothetical protein
MNTVHGNLTLIINGRRGQTAYGFACKIAGNTKINESQYLSKGNAAASRGQRARVADTDAAYAHSAHRLPTILIVMIAAVL